jgi:hypothetical protein
MFKIIASAGEAHLFVKLASHQPAVLWRSRSSTPRKLLQLLLHYLLSVAAMCGSCL